MNPVPERFLHIDGFEPEIDFSAMELNRNPIDENIITKDLKHIISNVIYSDYGSAIPETIGVTNRYDEFMFEKAPKKSIYKFSKIIEENLYDKLLSNYDGHPVLGFDRDIYTTDRIDLERRIDVDKFNMHSRELQLTAGVDPELCMSIVEPPIDDRLPLGVFLAHIKDRKFPTSSGKKWREHDEYIHFGIVRSVHPVFAQFLAEAAAAGLQSLEEGDEIRAVRIGIAIDLLLSPIQSVWDEEISSLIFTMQRAKPLNIETSQAVRDSLLGIQDAHTETLINLDRSRNKLPILV